MFHVVINAPSLLQPHVTLHSHLSVCLLLSDAFDFQFGAVILRLKEGLDVSHIQGQGIKLTQQVQMFPIWTCNIMWLQNNKTMNQ